MLTNSPESDFFFVLFEFLLPGGKKTAPQSFLSSIGEFSHFYRTRLDSPHTSGPTWSAGIEGLDPWLLNSWPGCCRPGLKVGDGELAERLGGGGRGRRPGRGEAGTKPEIRSKSAAPKKSTGRCDCASARVVPLQPVDHVSHQGIGDAREGLFCQQDGCPQFVQDQGVPVHLLLSRFELETQGKGSQVRSSNIQS